MNIYYAHHQWKYHTLIETYELELIKRYFPDSKIFNPSIDLTSVSLAYSSVERMEEAIMAECLTEVEKSDILVFSSLDGCIGTGVYHEVMKAKEFGKLVFYIYHDQLYTSFSIAKRGDQVRTDRIYAIVEFTN